MNSEWGCFIRAQRGDEMAWRMLIAQYRTRLTTLALFITGSASAAEDVAQETFVRAISTNVRRFTGTVSGFLGTIAYRLALKEARRERQSVELNELALADAQNNPLEELLSDERTRAIAAVIDALDDKHRDVLVLRLYGGCSYEEIADLLQIAVGTAKSRMFNATRACREGLKKKGITE